jgi:hypothetical protein
VFIALLTFVQYSVKNRGGRNDKPYLAMASGFFGRIARGYEKFPINDIRDFIQTVERCSASPSEDGDERRGRPKETSKDPW